MNLHILPARHVDGGGRAEAETADMRRQRPCAQYLTRFVCGCRIEGQADRQARCSRGFTRDLAQGRGRRRQGRQLFRDHRQRLPFPIPAL